MQTLAAFLLSIVGSLASRVLISLGIAIASYASLTALANTVSSKVNENYALLNSTVLSLLNLAGAGQILAILLSALAARASISAIKKFVIQ
jgi:hypothetical protein